MEEEKRRVLEASVLRSFLSLQSWVGARAGFTGAGFS